MTGNSVWRDPAESPVNTEFMWSLFWSICSVRLQPRVKLCRYELAESWRRKNNSIQRLDSGQTARKTIETDSAVVKCLKEGGEGVIKDLVIVNSRSKLSTVGCFWSTHQRFPKCLFVCSLYLTRLKNPKQDLFLKKKPSLTLSKICLLARFKVKAEGVDASQGALGRILYRDAVWETNVSLEHCTNLF